MAKRRFISFLPEWNQTEDLASFFGVTVDEVFQPGRSDQISGYIGRRPTSSGITYTVVGDTPSGSNTLTFISTAAIQVGEAISGSNIDDNTYIIAKTATVVALNKPTLGAITDGSTVTVDQAADFYVGEPTASRAAYQLESGMISLDDTGTINNAMTYPDLINYLSSQGAIVTDHQRLFEQEFYSWGPPINIDMILNYRNYCWFGDPSGKFDLPILTLTIPYMTYTGDGTTTTYALPDSINAVSSDDEVLTVYVDGLPVLFGIVSDSVVLNSAPSPGSTIMVARVFDFVSTVSGETTVDVSDINTEGVTTLSSGMRVRVLDMFHVIGAWDGAPLDSTLWDASGHEMYLVDGIGQSVRFTDDDDLLYDVEPQYVTIDRSSRQINLWSLHNVWVHKDTFAWAKVEFPARKAVRPIIEFVRDLVMYSPQTWSESTDPLFMLYDLEGHAYNDPGFYPSSNFTGNRIFGFAQGSAPTDPILHRSLQFDVNSAIVFEVDAASKQYTFVSGITTEPITGLACYRLDDDSDVNDYPLWFHGAGVTTQDQTNGFFNVPLNLQANPSSLDVTSTSSSTDFEHFQSIISNQPTFTGQALGDNNYRDTARDLGHGNVILQHHAPMLKLMLLASNTQFDLIQAIRYADQEYNRFRNKFARKLVDMNNRGVLQGVDPILNPLQWVTTALIDLRRDKNASFPFALNRIGNDQYFIPPTPAALGIMPAAVPTMVTDSTYQNPVLMIQGHDGSLTPAFNDWRDNVMLQLETLIYTNLPSQFQTEARPGFDIQQWTGGRFLAPVNGYSRNELTTILTPMFELWAQLNRFDYRTNKVYDPNNPFTWNYRGVTDRFGNVLPGNWRAIYRWYYNTDSPHTRPWEMLGFASQPSWWVTSYGSPPYVRSNTQLWHDLEYGMIAAGPRAGNDPLYERPGLADLIPVDDLGNLLDPIAIGIVDTNVSFDVATAPWMPGDHGPAENLWLTSPSYRYALAIASYLMKPARFVEECWDLLNIGFIGDQWVELATSPRTPFTRPQNSAQYVFGETMPNGTVSTMTGISQWIADYMLSSGQSSSTFGQAVRNLDVRLIHQMAGFVSMNNVQVVADSFGLVPSEDVTSVLYNSPVFDSEVYSGVIIEWTGRSWRVIGYDGRDPAFTIIPGDPNGPKGVISLANAPEPSIVPWRPNTYYPVNILVVHLNSVYESLRGHTSGSHFESQYWKARPDLAASLAQAPRVVTYARGLNTTKRINYGTEFVSLQDVADMLLGWERWLVSRGWIFDQLDPTTGSLRNWTLSVREWLAWTQVKWAPGNFIALSPGMQGIKFSTDTGTILNVEDNYTGFFGLIDRSGAPISNRNAVINRLEGEIEIQARNADIFCARIEISEIEHLLVFDNVTVFSDNIYLPLFNQRQSRLRLICNRAQDWKGRLDAPGFIIIGNQLRSSFDKAVDDIRLMFDIELSDRSDLRAYARHVIGFQERDYLDNLLLSDIEQFEFYQGMISQKGASGVFQKLMRSNRASENSDLLFLEEWAIRLGEFGAPVDPFLTFAMYQVDVRDDPQLIRFVGTNRAPRDWIIAPPRDPRWVDRPHTPNFFPMLKGYPPPKLPTAGPVRLDEVQYTAFSLNTLANLYTTAIQNATTPFPVGSVTWVYQGADGTYAVLHSFDTADVPNAILQVVSNAEDSSVTTSRIIFQQTMTLTADDIGNYIVVDGSSQTSPDLAGMQVITAVDSMNNSVDLQAILSGGYDFTSNPATAPLIRVLRNVRFADRTALATSTMSFSNYDLVWIDADTNGLWSVLAWNGASWEVRRTQPPRTDPSLIVETVIYELATTIVDQRMLVDQPVVDDVVVIDPLAGLIAGVAAREIDYRTEYDPARYNAGPFGFALNPWGAEQVGRVWWNLATVKFLDPFTDVIGINDIRDAEELTYRSANWSRIAPNTSVDVYEWVQSTVDPVTYSTLAATDTTGQYTGTVYFAVEPSWVETMVFDRVLQQTVTYYYFWVAGRTTTPNVPFRHMDVASVALAIENPSALDLQWLAAIHSDTMIVSGVSSFLDDTATVLKVRLTVPDHERMATNVLAEADFEANNYTLLQDYVSSDGTGFTQIDDSSDAEMLEGMLVGTGGTASYAVNGAPPSSPNYTLQFTAVPMLYNDPAPNGKEIYAIGRADANNNGYKIAVHSNGTLYSLIVTVMNTTTSVSLTLGTIPSGYYAVKLDLLNSQITATVQRSYDGSWLASDSSWSSMQQTAVSLTDITYGDSGQVIIGGDW